MREGSVEVFSRRDRRSVLVEAGEWVDALDDEFDEADDEWSDDELEDNYEDEGYEDEEEFEDYDDDENEDEEF